jgi:hypothetical protein
MLKSRGLKPPGLFIIPSFIVNTSFRGHFRFPDKETLTFANRTDPLI